MTMDYIFAIVLILGFSGILFSFAFTLSLSEITQYITYSAARTYMASHRSEGEQAQEAGKKYKELIQNPVVSSLYKSGWFKVQKEPLVGHISMQRFPGNIADPDYDIFWGVGTDFTAELLDFHIPFYGSTASDSQSKKSGFTTFIASYLGRESTVEECLNFNRQRWNAIKNLDSRYKRAKTLRGAYALIADNGC